MARGSGRGGRGSGVPCRNIAGQRTEPEINPNGALGGESGRGGAGDDSRYKELFTVQTKNDLVCSAMSLPSETLQDFIAELQRSARLLRIIEQDEHVEHLVLELKGGSDGQKWREMGASTSASTLGSVQACLGVGHRRVAVLTKPEPPSAVPGDTNPVLAQPNTTPPLTENHCPAWANTVATAALVVKSEDSPLQQKSPQTPSPFVAPDLSIWPSSEDDDWVGGLPQGNCELDRPKPVTQYHPPRHFTLAELTCSAHLKQREKAAALGVCMSTFKKARREAGLGLWPGRKERARLRHLSETQADDCHATIAYASLMMRGDLARRCAKPGCRS